MNHMEIINFWFTELRPKDWWTKSPELDQKIQRRFHKIHTAATQSELYQWRKHPLGRLAEIIVLDQFSRNIYRDSPQAFANDGLALALAQEAVSLKIDLYLNTTQRSFLYLPFMHSESLLIHKEAVKLYSQPGLENNLDFEHKHKVIIEKFGRYPHRNSILDRKSTLDELDFLKTPGSSF